MPLNIVQRLKRARAELHQTHHLVSSQSPQSLGLLEAIRLALSDLQQVHHLSGSETQQALDRIGAIQQGLREAVDENTASQQHTHTALAALVAAVHENSALTRLVKPDTWVPPGHFYSPIVNTDELQQRRTRVFDRSRRPAQVDMRDEAQLALLTTMKPHYDRLPFKDERQDGLRYHYGNDAFGYGDAIVLACLLMELRPKRIVEVGSGFSSCVTMDVNDLFLDKTAEITFVEPYPDLLHRLMTPDDRERHRVIARPVQDLDLAVIDELAAGDVLFIDSTHITKGGSDVNFEFFDILPRVKSGVYIHFHDMFYPFEYPEEWFFTENRSWNELYLMHAFLAGNRDYEIVFFNHFMHVCHREATEAALPLFAGNPGGSLWLRKL